MSNIYTTKFVWGRPQGIRAIHCQTFGAGGDGVNVTVTNPTGREIPDMCVLNMEGMAGDQSIVIVEGDGVGGGGVIENNRMTSFRIHTTSQSSLSLSLRLSVCLSLCLRMSVCVCGL